MGSLETCLVLKMVSRPRRLFSVLILVLRPSVLVLVLRKMSWCQSLSKFLFFLFLQFQNIRTEVVLHTPFFMVILLTEEHAVSISFNLQSHLHCSKL